LFSDGANGAIVFSRAPRPINGSTDIQAQRITATGTQQWPNPALIL
jgi:hypothetical protein